MSNNTPLFINKKAEQILFRFVLFRLYHVTFLSRMQITILIHLCFVLYLKRQILNKRMDHNNTTVSTVLSFCGFKYPEPKEGSLYFGSGEESYLNEHNPQLIRKLSTDTLHTFLFTGIFASMITYSLTNDLLDEENRFPQQCKRTCESKVSPPN